MRTTEFLFGKGKQEYAVTGILLFQGCGDLVPATVESHVRKAYFTHPWSDDENPSITRNPTITVTHVQSCADHKGSITVEMRFDYRFRQGQLRAHGKHLALLEHVVQMRYEYMLRTVIAIVQTRKEVGRWAH